MKPAPYRIFRRAAGAAVLLIQVRDPETGKHVLPADLEAYRARVKINTPWHGLERLAAGSRLMLTPAAARFLLAAGSIESMEEPPLIISRESRAEPGRADLGGDQVKPKAEPIA